ncbi:GNAT family N-acetyltransferase [Agromyces sp. NPDC056379]|uniref:GNAT family N-acetyltransferase n=1 Tax=unclassified Agromyces TaxID=2639701 RepID=UPI0035D9C2BB
MADPEFRTATPDDIPEVLQFWQSSAENDTRPVDTAAAVERLIARDPDALIVAVVDGTVVGSVIAGWDGWRAHLYRLAVSPEFRRRGIGNRLLEHAAAGLSQFGAARIDAMVLDGNELGQTIWQSAGYSPQPEWSRWVKPA